MRCIQNNFNGLKLGERFIWRGNRRERVIFLWMRVCCLRFSGISLFLGQMDRRVVESDLNKWNRSLDINMYISVLLKDSVHSFQVACVRLLADILINAITEYQINECEEGIHLYCFLTKMNVQTWNLGNNFNYVYAWY